MICRGKPDYLYCKSSRPNPLISFRSSILDIHIIWTFASPVLPPLITKAGRPTKQGPKSPNLGTEEIVSILSTPRFRWKGIIRHYGHITQGQILSTPQRQKTMVNRGVCYMMSSRVKVGGLPRSNQGLLRGQAGRRGVPPPQVCQQNPTQVCGSDQPRVWVVAAPILCALIREGGMVPSQSHPATRLRYSSVREVANLMRSTKLARHLEARPAPQSPSHWHPEHPPLAGAGASQQVPPKNAESQIWIWILDL